MSQELILALDELEKTRGIKKDYMIEAIEAALVAASKKHFPENIYIRVKMDPETGVVETFTQRKVCEEIEDPVNEISLDDARNINPRYEVDDFVESPVDPMRFGRIAAQTAKQVVVQRIREAERGNIFNEFSEKEGKLVTGIVQKADRKGLIVSLEDNAEGLLTANEQISGEEYPFNKRMKFYVLEIRKSYSGPQIMLSRTHPGLIRRLFEQEVPEIADGTVEIKSIVREAGSRTKMAVYSSNDKVDPIGACVGQKGTRVSAVMDGMGDEKIDIIKYNEDPAEYIKSALSPSKVTNVTINEDEKSAFVTVPDYQLSLAIGKEGQNVRIAARLTGWKIDIKSDAVIE
ncbi:MAG: transcription termination factor NusA [Bacillota bacterium]|nr:transcription termination factor NusA [Bacillota bacterium]